VSKDCQLRITDFGLARFMDEVTLSGNNRQNPLTEYVVTRWYRCPELLLSPNQPYSAAIDIWSIGCIIGELIKRKPLFPGKSHANQVQLILEVRGYSGPGDVGFELSSEATSFLDRRCRYPGKSLASFIPQASPEALELLEKLMDLNPKNRPSATGALDYAYIRDAQLLHDYTDNVMPRRVDEKFFDFEREEYSLEALQQMVLEEVARPCDDSIFFTSPVKSAALARQTSPGASQQTASASSLSQASSSGSFGTAYDSSQGHSLGHKRAGSDAHPSEGDDSARVEYSARGSGLMRSDSTASADAPASRGLTRSKSAPPSPSPQKMEMIAKQEKKHKRRFFLQGLQRLKQDQQEGDIGSSRSDREVGSTGSKSYGSGPEDLTSRRDREQPAGVLRGNGSKYLQSSSASGAAMESRDAHRGSASADPSSSSHLFSQFTNMGFSRGTDGELPARKLASAPPPSDSRLTTRLPALQNRGSRQQSGYR
jgi:serine/threonine protein kinase